MLATRLWQNTAKVHFDATRREDGRRLIYGGHVISLARALSFNGLANAQAGRRRSTPAPTPTPASPATPSAPGPRCSTRPRRAAPGRRRAPAAHGGGEGGRRPSRSGTRRGSTCPRCCSTSTTGRWCRSDGSGRLAIGDASGGNSLRPTRCALRNFVRAGTRRRAWLTSTGATGRFRRSSSARSTGRRSTRSCRSATASPARAGARRDARRLVVHGRGDRARLLRLRRRAAHLLDRRARHDRVAGGALVPLLQRHPAPGLGRRRRASRSRQIRPSGIAVLVAAGVMTLLTLIIAF